MLWEVCFDKMVMPSPSALVRCHLILPLLLAQHLPPAGGSLSKGEAIAAFRQSGANLQPLAEQMRWLPLWGSWHDVSRD